jgi:hypothetical protein
MKFVSILWTIPALIFSLSASLSVTTLAGSLAALLLPPTVSAANSIQFTNHCPYDIFLWAVGPATSNFVGQDSERTIIPSDHGSLTHYMVNTEHLGSGMTLKLRDYPEYRTAPAGILQVEYHFEPSTNSIWYDMSAVDCDHSHGPEQPSFCPLLAGGIKLHVPGADTVRCPPAWCDNNGCNNVYTEHGTWPGEPTFRCHIGVDVVIETCVEGVGPQTFGGDHPLLPSTGPEPTDYPSEVSLNGKCGANSGRGSVCRGSTHGDCCSGTPPYCSLNTTDTNRK